MLTRHPSEEGKRAMADTGVKYTKPFANEEENTSIGDMKFSPRNRSKTEKILAVVVIVLLILLIIFLALFANERGRYNDCKSSSSKASQGQ